MMFILYSVTPVIETVHFVTIFFLIQLLANLELHLCLALTFWWSRLLWIGCQPTIAQAGALETVGCGQDSRPILLQSLSVGQLYGCHTGLCRECRTWVSIPYILRWNCHFNKLLGDPDMQDVRGHKESTEVIYQQKLYKEMILFYENSQSNYKSVLQSFW